MIQNIIRRFSFLLTISLILVSCHSGQPKLDAVRTQLTGHVKSMNYTHRGDIDGYVLENGEVIQVGAKEIKRFNIFKGDQIFVIGNQTTLANGTKIVEAIELNGQRVCP